MSGWRRAFTAMALVISATVSAGEIELREQIANEAAAAFAKEDFDGVERKYSEAMAKRSRTPSGRFVAHLIFRGLLSQVTSDSASGPGGPRGRDDLWDPAQERAKRWMAARPGSTLAVLALCDAYVEHAWDYRGTAAAHQVGEEQWRKFHHYLALAEEALLRHQSVGEKDPNWHYLLLQIGRVGGWPQRRYWEAANKAMTAHPEQHDLYMEIATALVPQWGGSHAQLQAFAEHASSKNHGGEGRALYARILWSTYHWLSPDDLRNGRLNWPKLKAGFEDVVRQFPVAWNVSYFARLACDAQDKPAVRQLLERSGDDIDMHAWGDLARLNRCRQWAAQ